MLIKSSKALNHFGGIHLNEYQNITVETEYKWRAGDCCLHMLPPGTHCTLQQPSTEVRS